LHPERIADRFASSLLMPAYIFAPIARAHSKTDFQTVRAMAESFDTSQTATAIRLVEDRHFVACLVWHGRQGQKGFACSPHPPGPPSLLGRTITDPRPSINLPRFAVSQWCRSCLGHDARFVFAKAA